MKFHEAIHNDSVVMATFSNWPQTDGLKDDHRAQFESQPSVDRYFFI